MTSKEKARSSNGVDEITQVFPFFFLWATLGKGVPDQGKLVAFIRADDDKQEI